MSSNQIKAEVFGLRKEVFQASGLFLGSGLESEGFVERQFGFDHGVEDACEFVGGGSDAFGFAEARFHLAAEVAEFGSTAAEGLGTQAQDGGDFIGNFAGGGFEDFAAADAVVGAESEPGAEALGGRERLEDLSAGSQFAHEGAKGGCRDAIDGGEIDSVEAQGFLENQVAFVGFVTAQRFAGFEVLGGRWQRGGDGLKVGLDFEIELGDLFEELAVGLMALTQDENVFAAVVAAKGFDDLRLGGAATHMTKGSQNDGVAFALEDGVDDGRAAESVQVAEHMMEVEVHFGERFLHELDLARGVGDEVGSMPEQGAQGNDVVGGAETFAQESGGVKLLEPLGVDDIGLFPGHAFDMAGVDKEDLDAGFFEDAMAGNPEAPGAFHGDRGNAIFQKPVTQFVKALGEGRETADGLASKLGRDRGNDFAGRDIESGSAGVEVAFQNGSACVAFGLFHRRGSIVRVVDVLESGAAVAKRMEQSPKRGRRIPLRGRAATTDQLARATAMLKNGIRRSSRRLTSVVPAYSAGLQPHIATRLRRTIGLPLLLPIQPRLARGLLRSSSGLFSIISKPFLPDSDEAN